MIIYIEEIFFINFISNLLLLSIVLLSVNTSPDYKIYISSFLLSLSIIIQTYIYEYSILIYILKITSSILSINILLGTKSIKKNITAFISLFLASNFIVYIYNYFSEYLYINSKSFYIYPMIILLIIFPIICMYISSSKVYKQKQNFTYKIIVENNGKKIIMKGLLDTANNLTDPIDFSPVIFINKKDIIKILHQNQLINYLNNPRYISINTASSSAKMKILKLDKLTIENKKAYKNISCIIDSEIFKNNNICNALLNCAMQ